MSDFVTGLIARLRTADFVAVPLFAENARRLADNLEWRTAHPQGDAYDIQRTGDEAADRAAVADFLLKAARAGAHLAPSWTRTFSEAMSWLVRNGHDLSIKSVVVGATAAFDSSLAAVANEQGIDAAYDALGQPSGPQDTGQTTNLKRALERLRQARRQNSSSGQPD
jgi:hypothetical protein